jgi:hypothetical protein
MHLVGYLYEDYHDARSLEHKAYLLSCSRNSPHFMKIYKRTFLYCFRTCPDRSWGPPNLLYNGSQGPFVGVKRLGRCLNQTPPSSAKVKEGLELDIYSTFGPSQPIHGLNSLYPFHFKPAESNSTVVFEIHLDVLLPSSSRSPNCYFLPALTRTTNNLYTFSPITAGTCPSHTPPMPPSHLNVIDLTHNNKYKKDNTECSA